MVLGSMKYVSVYKNKWVFKFFSKFKSWHKANIQYVLAIIMS